MQAVEGEKERPEERVGDWGSFDGIGCGHEHLVGGRGPQLHLHVNQTWWGWGKDDLPLQIGDIQLTRNLDWLFSKHALMASITDKSSMSLSSMLGGQRRVRHTELEVGQDGVRLHNRQESPCPCVADVTVSKAGLLVNET